MRPYWWETQLKKGSNNPFNSVISNWQTYNKLCSDMWKLIKYVSYIRDELQDLEDKIPNVDEINTDISELRGSVGKLQRNTNNIRNMLEREIKRGENVRYNEETEEFSFYDKYGRLVQTWTAGGGISVLPNACPIGSVVISSIDDVVNATDPTADYCLQSNIALDTTLHGVIDNFTGRINLNGYTLSHTGSIPFTNFRGTIYNGIISTTVIENITSNEEGVEVPEFQNLNLSSQLANTCDCSTILYGVISSNLLFNITSNNLVVDSCKLSNSSFAGNLVNLSVTNSYITVDTHRTDYMVITNLSCINTKLKYTRGSFTYPDTASSYGLFKNEVGQTHNYVNCIVSGDCSIGTVTGSSSSIPYEGVFTGEGIINIDNTVIMLGTVSFGYNVTFGGRLISVFRGGGVFTATNSFEYINTKYVASSFVKYNDEFPTEVTGFYDKTLITADNFANVVLFDSSIWDLGIINDGYIPNLKNGSSYQNKDLISDLPEREV